MRRAGCERNALAFDDVHAHRRRSSRVYTHGRSSRLTHQCRAGRDWPKQHAARLGSAVRAFWMAPFDSRACQPTRLRWQKPQATSPAGRFRRERLFTAARSLQFVHQVVGLPGPHAKRQSLTTSSLRRPAARAARRFGAPRSPRPELRRCGASTAFSIRARFHAPRPTRVVKDK